MIGIRREDKSEWEARVPLVPSDLKALQQRHDLRFRVQSSQRRAFKDAEYVAAGIDVVEQLDDCPIIMGVKEIPPELFEPERTYVYFSHTIKGQPANMPALRRLLELQCNLIDYERIVDDQNRRLVFFGRYAGLAGMIDTLWALGQRLNHEGIESPFARVLPAHRYDDLDHVRRDLGSLAHEIRQGGLPIEIVPFVCGFAGYGQVSQGAQEMYDLLPVREVSPRELGQILEDPCTCFKVVFREEHMVTPTAGSAFALQEYYVHPERYRAAFFPHVRHLTVLVNCIYWEPKYPRLITSEQFRKLYAAERPRLRVIGDITCDIDGSLACTTRSTDPGNPVYTYDPATGATSDGVAGSGPVVLAVDFLPCELPLDASTHFSQTLRPFLPALAQADFSRPLEKTGLPPELARATIVLRGELTEAYRYLEQHLQTGT